MTAAPVAESSGYFGRGAEDGAGRDDWTTSLPASRDLETRQYGETRRPSGMDGQTQQNSSRLEHARRVLRRILFGLGSVIWPDGDDSVKWRTGVVFLA